MAKRKINQAEREEWRRKIALRNGNEKAILADGTVANRSRNRPATSTGACLSNAVLHDGYERPEHVRLVVPA